MLCQLHGIMPEKGNGLLHRIYIRKFARCMYKYGNGIKGFWSKNFTSVSLDIQQGAIMVKNLKIFIEKIHVVFIGLQEDNMDYDTEKEI